MKIEDLKIGELYFLIKNEWSVDTKQNGQEYIKKILSNLSVEDPLLLIDVQYCKIYNTHLSHLLYKNIIIKTHVKNIIKI
jgi:hypothetical protein